MRRQTKKEFLNDLKLLYILGQIFRVQGAHVIEVMMENPKHKVFGRRSTADSFITEIRDVFRVICVADFKKPEIDIHYLCIQSKRTHSKMLNTYFYAMMINLHPREAVELARKKIPEEVRPTFEELYEEKVFAPIPTRFLT